MPGSNPAVTGFKTILVIYVSVGQGHRRAARAVEEALRAGDQTLRIVSLDLLELWPSGTARLAARLYRALVRSAPAVWASIYHRQGLVERNYRRLRTFHRLIRRRLARLIGELNPAAVVCTQALPCALAARCKSRPGEGFSLVAVPTDFRVHPYWIQPEVDLYLMPTRQSAERLAGRGVEPERIRETGIPVRTVFTRKENRELLKRKYGLAGESPTVLLMGGGEGSVSLERLATALDGSGERFRIAALTGRNRKQHGRLRALRSRLRHPLTVFDFTDLVEELMSAVEVIVTKPGGLTCAEALVKRLPLVLVDPLPGPEELNAEFLSRVGAAVYAPDNLRAARAAVELLREGDRRRRVLAAMDAVRKPDAARDAARMIIASIADGLNIYKGSIQTVSPNRVIASVAKQSLPGQ